MRFLTFSALLFLALALLGGCATVPGKQVDDQIAPLMAPQEFDDHELLNVSIKVFDPGELPESVDERHGLSPEIREAEARFIPVHLKYTMQRTGYWGTVRIVPDDDNGAEVLVRGKIEFSDGESLVLTVEALDSRNLLWFRKTYAETALLNEHFATEPEKEDTFQDLFNNIANDLAQYRNRLNPGEILEIQRVAELRYGQEMAPDVYGQYLSYDANNRLHIVHLPAANDPMMERVRSVRSRDDMLIDAINGYYEAYYLDLWEPYDNWRKFRSEEVATMREIERDALRRKIIGVAAIVGAIAIGSSSDNHSAATETLQQVMVAGGAYSIYTGFQKSQDVVINKEVIEELGVSFSSEAEPLVVEVEGETYRLTGSAEEQYAKWREILKQIYARETGLITDEAIPDQPNGALP
ncbi:MAG: hypothetical protein IME97_08125 [Proteobacteria bacterium]|nr:hypothetical protein [Pseudomonadota bacterium]